MVMVIVWFLLAKSSAAERNTLPAVWQKKHCIRHLGFFPFFP
jgi:hypothetical protein